MHCRKDHESLTTALAIATLVAPEALPAVIQTAAAGRNIDEAPFAERTLEGAQDEGIYHVLPS